MGLSHRHSWRIHLRLRRVYRSGLPKHRRLAALQGLPCRPDGRVREARGADVCRLRKPAVAPNPSAIRLQACHDRPGDEGSRMVDDHERRRAVKETVVAPFVVEVQRRSSSCSSWLRGSTFIAEHHEASSVLISASMSRPSAALRPAPARWPQSDGMIRNRAPGMCAASASMSSGGK